MDEPRPAPTPVATVEPDSVRIGIRARCELGQAWAALAYPDRLRQWFADLDPPWAAGGSGRVDFGDGDFFDVTVHEVVDRELIGFEWRFLGLGPTARIRWRTRPVPGGTEITVEDRAPDRTAAEVDELAAGWTDFFGRLGSYLATGAASRYHTRDRIDGSVTLPRLPDRPLALATLYRWLPIVGDQSRPRFFNVEGQGLDRFRLEDWRRYADRVTFSVAIPGATAPTRGSVQVEPAGQNWRLSFSHSGWCRLGLPDRQVRQLRRRFTRTWVASLERARELATAP